MGTGGVFRTVLYYLVSECSAGSITVLTRDVSSAMNRLQGFQYVSGVEIAGYDSGKSFDVGINCTPLGIKESDPSPIQKTMMNEGFCALDLNYRERETAFMRLAEELGGKGINGRDMFFTQAYESFARIFGKPPDESAFRNARMMLEES